MDTTLISANQHNSRQFDATLPTRSMFTQFYRKTVK